MRRISPVILVALALVAAVAPAGASDSATNDGATKTSIVDRPPMDVGADQTNTIARIREDLMDAPKANNWWFDAGVSYPQGSLKTSNVDAGLLLRVNHEIWRDNSWGVVGSLGTYFGNDSYFNDQQDALADQAPVDVIGYTGVTIQSRYYMATPAMLSLQFAPFHEGSISPLIALGPGIVWSHSSEVTSAVNNGPWTVDLGDPSEPLMTGPGGEQGISPYAIRTTTNFNLGWEAKLGLGFRMTSGPSPLLMRIVATGTTYYHHTAPRTLLGFAASFSH
jgi:hypothetical protein